jgi:EmrB/QacA subfamily drug resistance transporter
MPAHFSSFASRRIALIVAAAFFMQLLDGVIIATALPQMALAFGVSVVELSSGVTVYLLTATIFIPVSGWLAERFGEKQVFLFAIALFTLASLACGLSQNLPQFIAARAVQGLGGAFMAPVGRMIVLRSAPKSELTRAIALITWPALFAPVLGPAIGGFITEYFSWHWNFFINLPLGAIGLLLVWRYVPFEDMPNRKPLDWPGLMFSSLGLATLLIGLELTVHAPGHTVLALALIAAGIALGFISVRHLRRAPAPLLDLTTFRHQTFAITNLFAGTYFRIAINATPFLLPLLFQVGFGLDPWTSGQLIMAYFLGNLGMKTVTTPLLRIFGFRSILVVNGVLGAGSIVLLALLRADTPVVVTVAILFVAGLTRSMQFTALNTLAFADIDVQQRASASTLSGMLQQISVLLGVAFAAGFLNLSSMLRGAATLSMDDFPPTFLVFAAVAFAASLLMLRIAPDAGEEVSGHNSAARAAAR